MQHSRNKHRIWQRKPERIELAEDLDIETVTEIFIRIVNIRRHRAVQRTSRCRRSRSTRRSAATICVRRSTTSATSRSRREFHSKIEKGDPKFAASSFWPKMTWLKEVNEDLYDPNYTDMLRVAFTSEFG